MPPTLEGVTLAFRSERFVLELPEHERKTERPRARTVRPPRISAPDMEGRFKLKPMRLFALRELLHIASAFRAQARIPLVPTELRKGPFAIDIPGGTELVIDLMVEDSHIVFDRDLTRGVIEPAIPLPLGLSFRGVNIREDGSVVADVSKLPIDVRWIRFRRLRIPASLDEINALLIRREAAQAVAPEEEEGGLALPLDYPNMVVAARDVTPRGGELPLGEAGRVELFEDSSLDVDYTPDTLSIRGHLSAQADLSGSGFIVRDARAFARASAEIRRPKGHESGVAVEVGCERAAAAEAVITLLDGSLFELRDVEVEGVHVWSRRLKDQLDWRVSCKRVRAHMQSGMLMLWIGGRAYELHIGETDIDGSFSVGNDGYEVDLEIQGAVLRIDGLHLDLGAADLTFNECHTRGTGRLRFTREEGVDFQGVLSVNADLQEGWLWAGPLRAHLLEDTQASFNVTRIAAKDGLTALDGTGTIELQLASGSIPVGRESELGFSRGATGTVAIHKIDFRDGMSWPHIEAGVQLAAQSDPLELGGAVTLPSGATDVEIGQIDLDPGGAVTLGEIEISMESDGVAEAAEDEELEETEDLGANGEDSDDHEPEPDQSYDSIKIETPPDAEAEPGKAEV